MNPIKFIFIVIIISFVYLACTDNPFFEDTEFGSDKLTISGNIKLNRLGNDNGVDDESGIFVWLEGLDVSTYTTPDGQFELQLSSPAILPGGATAWNGVYKLYYYVANYKYEYSSILIRNGKVEYGQSDVDDQGNINKIVQLTELLAIETTISPCSTNINMICGEKVDLSFNTDGETVTFETFVPLDATSGSVIFKKLDAPFTLSKFVLANKNTLRIVEISGSEVWNMQLGGTNNLGIKDMDPIPIESGEYEVVPYLVIEQEGLPEELLHNISKYYDVFSSEYLKLPFKWEVDTFIVK